MPRNKTEIPESLREIAEVIGLPAALALVTLHGGRRLYIPIKFPASNSLLQYLGSETCDKLSQAFGGDYLAIPRAIAVNRKTRNEQILQDHRNKATVAALAQKYDMTERNVWIILARSKSEAQKPTTASFQPKQIELFE